MTKRQGCTQYKFMITEAKFIIEANFTAPLLVDMIMKSVAMCRLSSLGIEPVCVASGLNSNSHTHNICNLLSIKDKSILSGWSCAHFCRLTSFALGTFPTAVRLNLLDPFETST